jgi:ketosteroid isomerase-like protein
MSRENLDLVRRTYAEWARGNMKAGTELFDAQIVFESFMPDASGRVVARGPQAIEAFMREFLAQWRDYRLVGRDFREVGSDRIVVDGYQAAAGKGSGAAVSLPMHSVWTFREGKVVRLIFEPDMQRALEAVGLRE